MKIVYDASFLLQVSKAGGIARDSLSMKKKIEKHFSLELFYPERYFLERNEKIHRILFFKAIQKILTLLFNLFGVYPKNTYNQIYWQSQPGIFLPPRSTYWILRLHDIFPITYPKDYSVFQQFIFKRSMKAATSRAVFVVNSLHTANQLQEKYGSNLKFFVIPCDKSEFNKNYCRSCSICNGNPVIPNKFILNVGTPFKRRNTKKILEFSSTLYKKSLIQTVLVGRFTSIGQKFHLKMLNKKKSLLFTGEICDAQLNQLYDSAVGYISLSNDEGFNIPVYDALDRKIPIYLSNIPAHRELVVNSQCYSEHAFFDDVKSMTEGGGINFPIKGILIDETEKLIEYMKNINHEK